MEERCISMCIRKKVKRKRYFNDLALQWVLTYEKLMFTGIFRCDTPIGEIWNLKADFISSKSMPVDRTVQTLQLSAEKRQLWKCSTLKIGDPCCWMYVDFERGTWICSNRWREPNSILILPEIISKFQTSKRFFFFSTIFPKFHY